MAERAGSASKPERFSPGKDYKLWLMRFKAFTTPGKIKDEEMAFAMINFFDNRALDALEALNISEGDMMRYKHVVRGKLLQRFAPVSDDHTHEMQFNQHCQEGESPNNFADALRVLTVKAYSDLPKEARDPIFKHR